MIPLPELVREMLLKARREGKPLTLTASEVCEVCSALGIDDADPREIREPTAGFGT